MPDSGAPACLLCLFRHVCHNAGPQAPLPHAPMALQPELVEVRTGEHVFRQGRPALTVYPLRHGSAKQVYESPLGWRQVTGFSLPGDVLGLEPHEGPVYGTGAIALQDAMVCAVSVESLRTLMQAAPFRETVLEAMRRNAERERVLLVAVGSMRAPQRLAMLLLDLAGEQARRDGNRDGALTLAMSRTDIASLLGLTLETVSRLLSRFASVGLISVRQRHLRIIDRDGLAAVYADLDPAPRQAAARSEAYGGEFGEPRLA
ncbi:cAMP-binding domain of CRP [Cupriavidus necator]|uniref:Crp/Fnr family transcriptional regulator n=1 Tax=Cupriavidus necator (strain ATCC 17699 / DSM 428 / KCTC 22496 / NCIMB 10442 / H16 / Stanier 337) TaxID=381666 RepID=Q0JZG8_CUPNH|nr:MULTISPECIES: Crp/Fnr family transcriptional regulator [Cupriavidus]QCC04658.1 Crp/Fnr family transcriptional regulator [Cupriavidus necator H16]QQB79350.1 Crp/Fnr family transcriptional regulator [Cupriavidus necator]WKA43578.1 Crp/Fnr family transcriptional regulator [Cupriavidus necator]CAJ96856.1 transcriptional regulator, FNR-like [Cupriavidus necator H16]